MSAAQAAAQKCTLSGYLTAAGSGESLISAALVERTSGLPVGESEVTYSACVAGKARGMWLQCDEHAPVLNMDQLVRLVDGTPFEWGSVWLPANRCVISSKTTRESR